MSPRGQQAGWAAVALGGVLLTFAPAVLGLRTLSHRDTDRLYAPVRTLVVEALRDGRLPLWNPYEGTGKPLFAEGIHSVLHPLSLLAAAVAPSSIDFLILSYLVAAALGAFLLARTLGASPPASAGAGLAFALSGYSVSMTGNLVFLAGLSTLPWLVAAARTAGAGSPWGTVATALATASAFFSGDAQNALVGLALGTLLAADAGGWRGAARGLAGMLAGILLASVQILATYELLPLTYRGVEVAHWEMTRWPLAPGRLLEWIVPGLFRGQPAVIPTDISGNWIQPVFAESVYLGVPLVVAAGLGVTRTLGRTRLLIGAAGVALLWLALGHHLGARQLLDWIPVWGKFRYSEKLMAPLTLCVCTLGALGIDGFGAGRLSRTWTRVLSTTALASGTILLALLIAPGATLELSLRLLGDPGSFYRSTLAAGLPHLVVGTGALLAIDRLRDPFRPTALALLVPLASAAAVYYGAHLGSPEARRFATPMRLESDSPTPRIAHPAERLYSSDPKTDFVDSQARSQTLLLSPSANVAQRVDTIDPYGGLLPLRITNLLNSMGRDSAPAYRRFGLTHVVIPIPHDPSYREPASADVAGGFPLQRDVELGFELWAVPHRPWAFFARSTMAAPPQDAHPLTLYLLELGDDSAVVVEASDPPPTAPGRVLRTERIAETVRVDAESDSAGLLVVQDAFSPGWRASIDGQPAEILAADFLVRAVRWPAGRHTLEMVYAPPELRVGVGLSSLGALLLLLLGALAARRRRPLPVA